MARMPQGIALQITIFSGDWDKVGKQIVPIALTLALSHWQKKETQLVSRRGYSAEKLSLFIYRLTLFYYKLTIQLSSASVITRA
jgi:hypothetical protein